MKGCIHGCSVLGIDGNEGESLYTLMPCVGDIYHEGERLYHGCAALGIDNMGVKDYIHGCSVLGIDKRR